jgi:hypothetical protein
LTGRGAAVTEGERPKTVDGREHPDRITQQAAARPMASVGPSTCAMEILREWQFQAFGSDIEFQPIRESPWWRCS